VCNLCNAWVDFVLKRDRRGLVRFGSLQSEQGQALLRQYWPSTVPPDSLVLIEGDRVFTQSTAALRILKRLGLPWNLLVIFRIVPRSVRDAVYNFIARQRYRWFGRRETCRLPTASERARFL
jgi:predicted DCC family thiol-disulfide oxidoreductase YuxK